MASRPVLICENKCEPMELPPAKNAGTEHPSWPAGYGKLKFICPTCKEAQTYSAQNITDATFPGPPGKWQNVVHIVVRCREKDCDTQVSKQRRRTGSLLETRTLLAFDVPDHKVREEALEIFAQFAHNTTREIRCENEHVFDKLNYCIEVGDTAGVDRSWIYKVPKTADD